MMNWKKGLSTLVIGSAVLGFVLNSGCKKDDDDNKSTPAPSKSVSEMLSGSTDKRWYNAQQTAFDITNGQSLGLKDVMDCEKDDGLRIVKGGVYTDFFGTTKCPDMDDEQTSGTWRLIDNDKKVELTDAEGKDTTDIVSLSDNRLHVKQLIRIAPGAPAITFEMVMVTK
jgi:hypothetical protein